MPIDVHAYYAPPTLVETIESRASEFGILVIQHPLSAQQLLPLVSCGIANFA
jgi:hypothetical protein